MLFLMLGMACGEQDSGELPDCDTAADTGPFQVGEIDGVCVCEDARVEIGTGMESWESHDEGACLQMVHGPHGGWHLPAALFAENTRSVVEIVAYVEVGGERMTDELTYRVQLVDNEDTCGGYFPNMFLYLTSKHIDPELAPPELIACQEAVIVMCVDDTGGNATCTEHSVIVAPDDADVENGMVAACEACP